jgi:hypothetical protein
MVRDPKNPAVRIWEINVYHAVAVPQVIDMDMPNTTDSDYHALERL